MEGIFTKVYLALADESLPKSTWQRLYGEATPQRQAKADRLRFEKDKRLCLAAEGLLRLALKENGLQQYNLLTQEGGKPYLEGNPLYFNLSHSGSYVLCAVSSAPVGCDIEIAATPNLRMAQRFFCPEETQWIQNGQSSTLQADRFYRLWTLKESYVKAIGQGLQLPLNRFCFDLSRAVPTLQGQNHWHFREYTLEGYRCAICAQTKQISDLVLISL